MVGELYAESLIARVVETTDRKIEEEHFGLRTGRSCADQIFVVRELCEKLEGNVQVGFISLHGYEKIV